MLGTTARDLITHLDLWIGDESLAGAAAFLVGGVGRWDALRLSAMSASEIGPAWRHVLDVTRRRTSFGDEPVPPDAYLAVLLHAHEAMQGPGGPVTASLRAEQLGWMGSAREICIRLAGELYRYGMARGTGMREGAFLDAYRAVLECWDIVEELDDGLTPHQIRIWRGMRGVVRLILARRAEEPAALLAGGASPLEPAMIITTAWRLGCPKRRLPQLPGSCDDVGGCRTPSSSRSPYGGHPARGCGRALSVTGTPGWRWRTSSVAARAW